MSRRHRAFREPTLDSSKANVRFSFQGPRPPTWRRQNLSVGCVGVANYSRRIVPVNYFLSDREDFFLPATFGAFSGTLPVERALQLAPSVTPDSFGYFRSWLSGPPSYSNRAACATRFRIPPGVSSGPLGGGPNVEPVVVGPISSVKDEPAFFSPNSTA